MKAKIWRILINILCYRKDLAEIIKPFYENLNHNSINEDQSISVLKTFTEYQLDTIYKNGLITEEKLNHLLNPHIKMTQSSFSYYNDNDDQYLTDIEKIIRGDRLEELQEYMKEKDINKINTIIAPFNEVKQMKIPIIQYCVMAKAMRCFKYLLVNGYDNPNKTMEEQNPNFEEEQFSDDEVWEPQHIYEWDCMTTSIYLGEIEMISILEDKGIEKGKKPTHLEAAVLSYRNEIAQEIIEKIIENNENNIASIENCFIAGIMASCKNDNIRGLEMLIKKGASVNIKVREMQSNSD